jgi:hypothetical protein
MEENVGSVSPVFCRALATFQLLKIGICRAYADYTDVSFLTVCCLEAYRCVLLQQYSHSNTNEAMKARDVWREKM